MAKILHALLVALLFVTVPVVASSSALTSSPGTDNAGTKLALSPALRISDNILITHAVLVVFTWAFFVPIGAIVLRLNIQSALLLKVHAYTQMCWYLIYIVAVGLGIWLAKNPQSSSQLGLIRTSSLGWSFLEWRSYSRFWV
jgi:hypothetical protein